MFAQKKVIRCCKINRLVCGEYARVFTRDCVKRYLLEYVTKAAKAENTKEVLVHVHKLVNHAPTANEIVEVKGPRIDVVGRVAGACK